ncbi:type III-B CRISPR-associated protein Cas10/Cmr2 [Acidianus sp. HS-5]|uniref:type III-B CRISPR-associated protein Cas10/Cmr2 n=1 Tax=Acidianus sp. HS-5 TaxID=2886040 RepID=UPI001F0064E2|nr:type III-B CRISPR-associated protein Cas10/Cmr2 [Acidianus sp. HS-5]BDC17369.1 type III-B CRISPR-associated protein Cas10/Cmr2 [Acidianus sp. HS-5]
MSRRQITIKDFVLHKIKALLHDPPNKPAVISWNPQAPSGKTRRKHETEAKNLAIKLFNNTNIQSTEFNKIRDSKIKKADSLASSIDRYLGSITYGNSSLFPENNIFLKNILQPSLYVDGKYKLSDFPLFSKSNPSIPLNRNLARNYISILNRHITTLQNNVTLLYQLFYLEYELQWINENLPVGPADTRNPTHNIFDHLYATAAMMNWILTFSEDCGSKRKGYLLGIDTVGVADFISKGRKTRDIWISSYLVSALLWYVITNFIEEYGPDVVLFPSLRFNQFYAFYLLEKLRKEELDDEVINEVEQLVIKYIFNGDELFKKLKIPPYPIIPGRVTFILPGFKKDGDQYYSLSDDNYFILKVKERYNKGWKRLIQTLRIYSEKKRDDSFWNLVCNVLNRAEELLLTSPLKIRVRQVSVEKSEMFESSSKLRSDAWKVYDRKYRKLVSEFKKDKLIKVTPESHLKLFELTRDGKLPQFGEKSKRGYEFCTSCGVLPAVVIMPSEEEFEGNAVNLGLAKDKDDAKKLKKLISPGERLCPWCLAKRALGVEPRLIRSLLLGDLYDVNELVDNILQRQIEMEVPSTSDIASIKIFEELIQNADEICTDEGQELCKEGKKEKVSMWNWFNNNYPLSSIDISINPEDHWFSEARRKDYISIFKHIGTSFPSPYYALVRADSDYLGDLLEGKLTPYLAGIIDSGDYANISDKKDIVDKVLGDYLINAGSKSIVNYVKSVMECIEFQKTRDNHNCKMYPCIEKIYLNEVYKIKMRKHSYSNRFNEKNYIQEVNKSIKYFNEIFNEDRIIVTPAWHVAISSALNRGLLLELELVNKHKGFVIYAGGDDLLVMLPVDEVLAFVKESRRAFAGYGSGKIGNMCLENGFVKIGNAYYPSLPIVGRSYSVSIAHYADPLSTVINDSYNLLEEGKEMIRYKIKYNTEFKYIKKDVAIFRYQGLTSVIPLSLKRPIVDSANDFSNIASILDIISELKRKIDEGKISTSLLYDYEDYKDLIFVSSENEKSVTQALIDYWIKSNSQRGNDEIIFNEELYNVRLKVSNYIIKIPQDLISNIVYTLRIIYGGKNND